jgi:hypothetical protein
LPEAIVGYRLVWITTNGYCTNLAFDQRLISKGYPTVLSRRLAALVINAGLTGYYVRESCGATPIHPNGAGYRLIAEPIA